ncbi:hypothetical protein E1B28_003663 [Marasmius oreades]|uniref:Uncharacterized protein n=1 Tax=Marasmius oreades TaxID=181124 RepID=A0A9P7UX13_9AGAR|nr:uncharacterized protein E1B28_003663 [Marasmius oreades]KAG7096211.1 hypothetical protein E1B28_003663 [Marasmius oreades]
MSDLKGQRHFAEILYFFLVDKGNLRYTCTVTRMYLLLDNDILEKSYNTLEVCSFLGDEETRIVDAKSIESVVGMIPFRQQGATEWNGTSYFVLEKLSSAELSVVVNGEELDELAKNENEN